MIELNKGTRVAIRAKESYSGYNGVIGTIVSQDKRSGTYCVKSDSGHYSWWTKEELIVQRKP